jgi:hypothetical protein
MICARLRRHARVVGGRFAAGGIAGVELLLSDLDEGCIQPGSAVT